MLTDSLVQREIRHGCAQYQAEEYHFRLIERAWPGFRVLTKRKLKFWANLILVIAAFPFVVLMVLMLTNPDSVSKAGKSWINHYASLHERQMNEAMEYLSAGKIEPVFERLDSWKEIKKGDRAYPLKRELLNGLAEYLHAEERFTELLFWSQLWYGLDERDVTASAFYFEALRHTQDRAAEGEEGYVPNGSVFPTILLWSVSTPLWLASTGTMPSPG